MGRGVVRGGHGGRSRLCPRTARSAGVRTVAAVHAYGGMSFIKHTDPGVFSTEKAGSRGLHVLIERDCQPAVRVS